MPRFFIEIGDRHLLVRDDIGEDLPDLETARDMALALLPHLGHDALAHGSEQSVFATVRDKEGELLFRATLTLSAR